MAEISDDCALKRKNKANKSEWQQTTDKRSRMEGKIYTSTSKKGVCQKPVRHMGEPCSRTKSIIKHFLNMSLLARIHHVILFLEVFIKIET